MFDKEEIGPCSILNTMRNDRMLHSRKVYVYSSTDGNNNNGDVHTHKHTYTMYS